MELAFQPMCHGAAGGVAWRAEYHLVIQGPSDPFEFIKWRTTWCESRRRP